MAEPITCFRGDVIACFQGPWAKLSNYSPCHVFYGGHSYQSVEHAYQAQKVVDERHRHEIANAGSPAKAKRLARTLPLREDWEEMKDQIMLDLLREKFAQEPERSILLSTGDAELIEGNWWGDRYWGQCPLGTGENKLGKLLMRVRSELQ